MISVRQQTLKTLVGPDGERGLGPPTSLTEGYMLTQGTLGCCVPACQQLYLGEMAKRVICEKREVGPDVNKVLEAPVRVSVSQSRSDTRNSPEF